jgi:hypothetical protein
MARSDDYISEVRALNRQVWEGIHALKAKQSEYNALDYGNTLPDGQGANEGYTADEVGSVVFDTTDALLTVLAAGHATNMSKLL